MAERSSVAAVSKQGLALLVQVNRDGLPLNNKQEFIGLVTATGAEVAELISANVRTPDSQLFIGAGKVEAIRQLVELHKPDLVIFNLELSPSQERNLERQLHCRVIDRTRLILDIFALRATSHEGKLQVELAQLSYLSTRLVRGWTHLERQRGGIGLRGPGETQLESDRRMLMARVAQLQKALKRVNKRRQSGRNMRNTKVVALAGYTNAGKTSLFNQLGKDNQFVANQLFASLDTKLRRISLPGTHQAVLVDTVGFVENLPHQLIEAFASTLEEIVQADLIVHVGDASDPRRSEKIHAVENVLTEIGAVSIPRIMVWNKCDLLPPGTGASLPLEVPCSLSQEQLEDSGTDKQAYHPLAGEDQVPEGQHQPPCKAVTISVNTGSGLHQLRQAIAIALAPKRLCGWFRLADEQASKNRAYLHRIGAIRHETSSSEGHLLLYLDADAAIVRQLRGLTPCTAEKKHLPALDSVTMYPFKRFIARPDGCA